MGLIQEGIAQQSGDTRIDFENLAREALQALPKKWWTEGWLSGSHHESSKSFHHRMAIHPRVPSKGFSKFKALSWPDFHCNRCNPHKTTIITDFLNIFLESFSHSPTEFLILGPNTYHLAPPAPPQVAAARHLFGTAFGRVMVPGSPEIHGDFSGTGGIIHQNGI